MEFQLLFQVLKDDAVKVLHSICHQISKTQQRPQYWKRSVFIPIPKKDNAKECSNYHTIALISHARKSMLKILRQRSLDHREGKGIPEKLLLLLHWLLESLWLCGSQHTGKFLKRWEYQTILPVSWETCIWVKKQQLEPDMEQNGSKLGQEYAKAVYCHPAYLTSMQSTLFKMLGWMNHKLGSKLTEEISTTSDMQMIPL